MARKSKIVYNPSLSVDDNAKVNGCTVDAIRYYIRTRGIDRRYEGKLNIIEDIKKSYKLSDVEVKKNPIIYEIIQ